MRRAAIVTGGGQGIGKATAKRLLKIGVAVVIADTDAEAGQETLAEYRQLKSAHGAIVNIASTRALMSEPGTEAYAASKGGIVALTHEPRARGARQLHQPGLDRGRRLEEARGAH